VTDLIIVAVLLALGFGFGTLAERSHYRSIRRREDELADILVFSARVPPDLDLRRESRLVAGNAVISTDYFKAFVAGLRGLIGGRITSYEGLLDRARREAILRLKADALSLAPCKVFNLKIETARISMGGGNLLGTVEVLAYGTAVADRA
jgi:uncharacterized protein YbjQ (UPF0145 family)